MALSPNGTLFVGSRFAGNLYAIKDNDGDGYGETITIIASKLRLPTGIAFKDKNLYIGVVNKILVMPDIEKNLDSPIIKTIKNDIFHKTRISHLKICCFERIWIFTISRKSLKIIFYATTRNCFSSNCAILDINLRFFQRI